MSLITATFASILQVFLVASPYILLGLAGAGLLHVWIPSDRIARWLGQTGFGATFRAALLGIPLPLCSCAVVPVTIELSRKGASREASLAFLVSTPETGVDSILLTWGLMGPVMAIVRPIAALGTSLVAATMSMLRPRTDTGNPSTALPKDPCEAGCKPVQPRTGDNEGRAARMLRYGFGEMVDEIGFWLLVGVALTGLITALVPADLVRSTLGQGPGAHVLLLLLGVPLYMCASASTPVAAALMLKGISPGAALVFLLAGPATNASSLVVIARFFGRRFVTIYLLSVVVSSLLLGWSLDWLLGRTGLEILPRIGSSVTEGFGSVEIGCAIFLAGLLLASAARGSWAMALRELRSDLATWRRLLRGAKDRP